MYVLGSILSNSKIFCRGIVGGGMMIDKDLYNKAICEMKSLAEYVMQDILKFADEHDYEEAWVVERFREEFNKISREEM